MSAEIVGERPDLERFRSYLLFLAQIHLDPKIRAKVGPSDIVQRTLIQAYRALPRFEVRIKGDQIAWLKKILVRNVAKASRDFHREKRDVSREISLEAAMDRSTHILRDSIAVRHPSPSAEVQREETLLRLSEAIIDLPPSQRDAFLLHHIEGLPLEEIGIRLGRTEVAVAGLLHRGLKKLREKLGRPDALG